MFFILIVVNVEHREFKMYQWFDFSYIFNWLWCHLHIFICACRYFQITFNWWKL